MSNHHFKIVEVAGKDKNTVGFFNYHYIDQGYTAILRRCIERVINERRTKKLPASPDDLEFFVVEGTRENGYAHQHEQQDCQYFYEESSRTGITLDSLLVELEMTDDQMSRFKESLWRN